jgi:UDP-glucose 4-epimerase
VTHPTVWQSEARNMRIFVTGVAGFLGSHLADAMLLDGHEVVGIDSLIGGELDNVHEDVEFHQVDCNDFERVRRVSRGCEIFYHCAATAYEGLSVFAPYIVTHNIVSASVSVFSAAISNEAKRIVLCSSMARYGALKPPFAEDQEPRPQDPYGIGKLAAEDILRNLCDTHGVEYVIAVPHSIIGPRQKYDDPFRNVASIMINLMLQGRQPVIYGEGKQQRCFSFIDDCLYCLKEMAFRDNVIGQTINIGPDEEVVTILELAERIANRLRFNLSPTFLPGRPNEVVDAVCSSTKARKMLGYRTTVNLDDGLSQMIDYIQTRGVRPFKYHIDLEIRNKLTPKTWSERLF